MTLQKACNPSKCMYHLSFPKGKSVNGHGELFTSAMAVFPDSSLLGGGDSTLFLIELPEVIFIYYALDVIVSVWLVREERRRRVKVSTSCRKKGKLLFCVIDLRYWTWAPKSAGQRFTKTLPTIASMVQPSGSKTMAFGDT